MVRAHLWISGLVQGVFYRQNTYEKANRLNLTGWVRNLPDGRVEAIAEGDKDTVNQLIDWCHEGPPLSRVESVDIKWENPTGEFNGFIVTY